MHIANAFQHIVDEHRVALMLSWPVRVQVDLKRLADIDRRNRILRGAIVGAPADPEAFG